MKTGRPEVSCQRQAQEACPCEEGGSLKRPALSWSDPAGVSCSALPAALTGS
ncbi:MULTISPECIES: hypothetical protein [Eubacterium]|uniref:hypothetical protein n=1 Tax=Eubacterium TaxID=1730 RepID=UPI001A9BCC35|nr:MULTISPECIES: hypothetical protein [Eubacterium]